MKFGIEIIAAIAMIGGLVLVAMQLDQNSSLLRTQLLFDESRSYVQWEQKMLGENPAEVWEKSLVSPEELTLSKQRIIEAYLWSGIEQWLGLYRLAQQGLIGAEWKTRVSAEANYLLGNTYGRAFWSVRRTGIESKEFVAVVDGYLKSDRFSALEYHQEVMGALKFRALGSRYVQRFKLHSIRLVRSAETGLMRHVRAHPPLLDSVNKGGVIYLLCIF